MAAGAATLGSASTSQLSFEVHDSHRRGIMEYVVTDSDTLERIAARCDSTPSEIMKLNKLASRMIFPGQRIYIPSEDDENYYQHVRPREINLNMKPALSPVKNDKSRSATVPLSYPHSPEKPVPDSPHDSSNHGKFSTMTPEEEIDRECLQRFMKLNAKYFTEDEGTVNGVLLVTPNCVMFDPDLQHALVRENGSEKYGMMAKMEHVISAALYKDISAMLPEGNAQSPGTQRRSLDERMYHGELSSIAQGSFLPQCSSTPNQTATEQQLIDFDPERKLSHDPQPQHGPGLAVRDPDTPSRRHVSESAAEDVGDLPPKHHDHLLQVSSTRIGDSQLSCPSSIERSSDEQLHRITDEALVSQAMSARSAGAGLDAAGVEAEVFDDDAPVPEDVARGGEDEAGGRLRSLGESVRSRKQRHSQRIKDMRSNFRRSLTSSASTVGSVGRKMTTGAASVGRELSTGAQRATGAVVVGAQSVGRGLQPVVESRIQKCTQIQFQTGVVTGAHTVVHGAQSVGRGLQTGAQGLQHAATNVGQLPRNIVNTATGLFNTDEMSDEQLLDIKESWFEQRNDNSNNTVLHQRARVDRAIELRRQKSYAKLEALKVKAENARKRSQSSIHFTCATSRDEKPGLFTPIDELIQPYPQHEPTTEMPYFLLLRLNPRRRQKELKRQRDLCKADPMLDAPYQEHTSDKSEFWFTVPKDRADALYSFFVQWTPEKYGSDAEEPSESEGLSERMHEGFVVLDSEEEDASLAGDGSSALGNHPFGPGSFLNREWEIVTIEEVKRRLSLQDICDPTKFPLPSGSDNSTILNESHIRSIVSILPARAEGYPWVLVYSTTEHGFSLRTLYRNMKTWNEEMSPTLLVVRDTEGTVFGGIVNCPILPSDHFYGSGESVLFTFKSKESSKTSENMEEEECPVLKEFLWTGENDYIVKGGTDSLAIGSGKGHFGLWLDGSLYHGRSQHCDTFDNEPLTKNEDFIIGNVEAWGFSMNI